MARSVGGVAIGAGRAHRTPYSGSWSSTAVIGVQWGSSPVPASRGQIARIDGNGASDILPGATIRP
jgi:hypothetical protein